jgi:hypothetical protein
MQMPDVLMARAAAHHHMSHFDAIEIHRKYFSCFILIEFLNMLEEKIFAKAVKIRERFSG